MRAEKTQLLTKEELVSLSRINPTRIAIEIGVTWLIILGSLQLSIWANSWIVTLVAFVLIACMQNALLLWTHEASHYSFSRNKRRNDILGDLFSAGPTGTTIAQYRWQHLPHHLHLNDPEHDTNPLIWMCVRGGHLYMQLFHHMTGWYTLKILKRYSEYKDDPNRKNYPRRSPASLISFVVVNGGIFLLCALQGQWYLYFILYVAPLFTLTMLINNFRSLVEHQPSSEVCDTGTVKMQPMTRVIRSSWLERTLIAPVGFYYHHEHHLFPAIPCHRLGDARRLLEQRGYFERPDIVWTESGYLQTIWKLAMQPGYGIRVLNPLFDIEHEHGEA